MKCFYHSSDLDGHCSGAIVKYAYPECEMYPINYEDDFPWEKIAPMETVYIVDFSLQPFEDMEMLNDVANLIWIDHHKTAIEEAIFRDISGPIKGYRSMDYAACELTWMYLFPDDDMPEAVGLLGRYDVWDHEDSEVYPFQMGMRLEYTDPSNLAARFSWDRLFEHDGAVISEIIERGNAIVDYQNQTNAKLAKSCAFEVELDGLKFIAANMQGVNSKFFDAVWDDDRHDAMLLFGWKQDKWTVSMFTTPEKISQGIDVGEVAKARGGGGHAGAAGFQCQELPFNLK